MAARGAAATQGVPEKFQNADGTVNMEAFTKSYLEMEKQFHAPADEAAEAAVEEAPSLRRPPRSPRLSLSDRGARSRAGARS